MLKEQIHHSSLPLEGMVVMKDLIFDNNLLRGNVVMLNEQISNCFYY